MQFGTLGWEDSLEKEVANPLHYNGLENPMDRGVWQAAVGGVAKGRDDLMTETLLTSPPQ